MPGMCAKRDKGVPLLRRGWPLGNCFFNASLAPKRINRRSQYAGTKSAAVTEYRYDDHDGYGHGYDSSTAETTPFGWRIAWSGLYQYRTLWARRQSNLQSGERKRMRSCALPPLSCSPHSTLPDAGTEPAAGSSHQPWPATLCRIKGLSQEALLSLLTYYACVYY